jgi:hypothetical protein
MLVLGLWSFQGLLILYPTSLAHYLGDVPTRKTLSLDTYMLLCLPPSEMSLGSALSTANKQVFICPLPHDEKKVISGFSFGCGSQQQSLDIEPHTYLGIEYGPLAYFPYIVVLRELEVKSRAFRYGQTCKQLMNVENPNVLEIKNWSFFLSTPLFIGVINLWKAIEMWSASGKRTKKNTLPQGLPAGAIERYKYHTVLSTVSPAQLYHPKPLQSPTTATSTSLQQPCSPKPLSLLPLPSWPSWPLLQLNVALTVGTVILDRFSAATRLRTRTIYLLMLSRHSVWSTLQLKTLVRLLVLTATRLLGLVLEELDAHLPPFAVKTTVSMASSPSVASLSMLASKSTLLVLAGGS